jgi:hypothetical protein
MKVLVDASTMGVHGYKEKSPMLFKITGFARRMVNISAPHVKIAI